MCCRRINVNGGASCTGAGPKGPPGRNLSASSLVWIDLADYAGDLSFIFVCPHDCDCSSPAWKLTIRPVARMKAKALVSAGDIFRLLFWKRERSPRDRRPMCSASRNHREGKAETAARFAQSDP